MQFRYAIVEDERASLLLLKSILQKLAPDAEFIWEAGDEKTALHMMKVSLPDVLFLDIQFPPKGAFSLLKRFKETTPPNMPMIIFATSWQQRAVKAFEWDAVDFLVKPVTEDRIKVTLERLNVRIATQGIRLLTEISDAVWVMSPDFRLQFISPAITQLTGFSVEEAKNLPMERRYPPETIELLHDFYNSILNTPLAKPDHTLELSLYRKDGSIIYCETRFHIEWEAGRLVRAYGTTTDITQRKMAEMELIRLLTLDQMTGATNKTHFNKTLQHEMYRAYRYSRPLSVIMLDIDNFKAINDTYGHVTGDKALLSLANTIFPLMRKSDVFGRVGGEEFAILLPEVNVDGAVIFAERIRAEVEKLPVQLDGRTVSFTVSLGCAQMRTEDKTFEVLIGRADHALYEAKRNGRNQVRSY